MSDAAFRWAPAEGEPTSSDRLLAECVKRRTYVRHERINEVYFVLLRKMIRRKGWFEVAVFIDGRRRKFDTTEDDGNGHLTGPHEDLAWAERSFNEYVTRIYANTAARMLGITPIPPRIP
jgi:hypothetical protein